MLSCWFERMIWEFKWLFFRDAEKTALLEIGRGEELKKSCFLVTKHKESLKNGATALWISLSLIFMRIKFHQIFFRDWHVQRKHLLNKVFLGREFMITNQYSPIWNNFHDKQKLKKKTISFNCWNLHYTSICVNRDFPT